MQILVDREKEWRIKSRAIWLQEGDENTKNFHRYATNRKNINSFGRHTKKMAPWLQASLIWLLKG
jgi:hypothetical protein